VVCVSGLIFQKALFFFLQKNVIAFLDFNRRNGLLYLWYLVLLVYIIFSCFSSWRLRLYLRSLSNNTFILTMTKKQIPLQLWAYWLLFFFLSFSRTEFTLFGQKKRLPVKKIFSFLTPLLQIFNYQIVRGWAPVQARPLGSDSGRNFVLARICHRG